MIYFLTYAQQMLQIAQSENNTMNCQDKSMAVTPTCVDHAGLVSHHAVGYHALLLLRLHESVWACGPYGVL